jgi:hypothetical protein
VALEGQFPGEKSAHKASAAGHKDVHRSSRTFYLV